MTTKPNFGPVPTPERNKLIWNWYQLERSLKQGKKDEKAARDLAVRAAFPALVDGTNTLELPDGWALKAQVNVTYKLVVPEGLNLNPDGKTTVVEAVDHMIERLRRASNEGAFIAERLVKWSPSIVGSEYKQLDDKLKAIVDEYIETDTKVSTVKMVNPNE